MSTIIKLKYSTGTAQPADNQLNLAEQAYSYNSGKLFIGRNDSGTIVPDVIGGTFFTDMLDHTAGTLTANSALIVDGNSKIDQFKVDDLLFDGNTLSTGTANTNLQLSADGTGQIVFLSSVNFGTNTVTAQTVEISTLTEGNVVLAGSNGSIVDNSLFNYTASEGEFNLNVTGSLSVDNVDINLNTISTTNENGNLNLTPNGDGIVVINKTNGFKVPVGNDTTQKPDAATVGDGVIRYNSDSNRFEGVVSGNWTGLGGVVDIDQDTYITADTAQGDTDTLTFTTAGVERLHINDADGAKFADTTAITANAGITVDNIAIDGDTININGSTISASGDSSSGVLVLDPAPAAGDNGGDLVIRGNLQVTGTQTIVNSTTVQIDDPIMVLGQDNIGDTLDRGVSALYNTATPITAGDVVQGVEYTITSLGDTDWNSVAGTTGQTYAVGDVITVVDAVAAAGSTGTALTTSTEATSFFGYDRSVDNVFTFVENGATGDARFQDLKLSGSIIEVDGVAPTAGQLLIGNTSNGDMQLGTLTEGDSVTITNGDGSIEIDVNASAAVATTDITNTLTSSGSLVIGANYVITDLGTSDFTLAGASENTVGIVFTATAQTAGTGTATSVGDTYTPAADNAGSRGASTFASEQFSVSSGHVVIVEIDGGTF